MKLEAPDQQRNLKAFRGDSYSKGRSKICQVAWMTMNSLVFKRWWMPALGRRIILRAFGASIGSGVLIRHNVEIHWPWKLVIGDNSWIGAGTWILNLEPVTIGSNTCISQDVLLCTGSHDAASPTFEFDNAPITIGSRVWVATRATVLRGVTVGDDALLGACTLVVKDVAMGTTLLGPAAHTATTGTPRVDKRC